MKKIPLLCATALTAAGVFAGGAMADTKMENPDAKNAAAHVKAEAANEATVMMRTVVQKRAFLDTLFKAQIALHGKDRGLARKHILDADKQLDAFVPTGKKTADKLPDDDEGRKNPETFEKPRQKVGSGEDGQAVVDQAAGERQATVDGQGDKVDATSGNMPAAESGNDLADAQNIYQDVYAERKVLEVEFGSTLMPEKAVMPVTDGQVTVTAIEKALKIDGLKKGELRDVDVRYIADKLDLKLVREQLNQAKDELVKNEFYGAQYDLLQIQRGMLEDGVDVVPPQTRARDNLALTRYLVGAEEFEAARETLNEAEAALNELSEDDRKTAGITGVKAEVKTLRAQIEKRDPTMLEKIDKKLEAWWKKLS